MVKISAEEKYRQMTETPISSLILTLSVPTVITNLISTLYNAADTFFIGKISTSASAAVGVVLSLQMVIQAIGFFFGQGTGTSISRELGKRDTESADRIATTGFAIAFLLSTLFMIICLIIMEPLAIFLGSTPTILPYALDYLKYILWSSPFFACSIVLNQQLRFQGYAAYSMIGITAGGVLNMVLDPLLIFVFDMGIKGAAIATTLSQMVSFTILLILHFKIGNVRLRASAFRFNWKVFKPIGIGGLPSLCRQSVASVAMICLNTAAKPYGDACIAAMTIANKVGAFTNSLILGFGQAYQPVCGFNYGAGKYKRVKEGFKFCVKLLFFILLGLAVIEFVFAEEIVSFFRKGDAAVKEIGSRALRFRCLTITFSSWIMISNMLLQTTGKVFKASILGFARQGIILIPIVAILPPIIGVTGLQIAQPVADLVTILMSIPMTLGTIRKMNEQARE